MEENVDELMTEYDTGLSELRLDLDAVYTALEVSGESRLQQAVGDLHHVVRGLSRLGRMQREYKDLMVELGWVKSTEEIMNFLQLQQRVPRAKLHDDDRCGICLVPFLEEDLAVSRNLSAEPVRSRVTAHTCFTRIASRRGFEQARNVHFTTHRCSASPARPRTCGLWSSREDGRLSSLDLD